MKKKILTFVLATAFSIINAQVGINTQEPKVTFEVKGNSSDTSKADGILAPALTGDQLKAKDNSYVATTSTLAGQTGAIVYVTNAVTGTPAGKTINVTQSGYYYFNGTLWKRLNDTVSATGVSYSNSSPGAVKIAVNQSGSTSGGNGIQSPFIPLNGTQSLGLLMQNQPNLSITPTYVTGVYPGGTTTGSPNDIMTSTTGSNGYALLEAPMNGNGNIYRLNMEYVMGNTPPSQTRYFNVRIESIGSGALIYENSIVVPGGLDTGHVAPFQIMFPTIADSSSIGVGYRIVFRVDTAASTGLPNNIGVRILDIARLNQ